MNGQIITPNRLTIGRVILACVGPALLISHRTLVVEWVALLVFTAACLTDWWDGHLARSRSMVTPLGTIADPIADKVLICGLLVTFALLRLYAVEWIVPVVLRETVVTVVRLIRLKQGNVLPAEWAGKRKVGFQIGSVYATFIYLMALDSGFFSGSVVLVLFRSIHYLGIALAVWFTLISGIQFFHRLDRT